jgi:hypothetical protein
MVTGMQAAGKSTIGPLLAERLGPPAAALDGDVFYTMVASGGVFMTPDPHPEAVRQLQLRYDAGALVAQHYVDGGFDFVYTDIVLGSFVPRWFARITNAEPHLVVLNPSADVIVEREIGRGKNSYRDWQGPGMSLRDAVESLQRGLAGTPRRGLWLDTSDLTARETVDAILADGMIASRY